MKRSAHAYLHDISESINLIQSYISDLTLDEFLAQPQIQDSIVRRFEIIGEAVKHLPLEFRKQHSEIAWNDISGMRDILIHEYFGIRWHRVWKTIHDDLPGFKKIIEALIDSSDPR